VLLLRLRLQAGRLPVFSSMDNPALGPLSPQQAALTKAYLIARHLRLLLFPAPLAADWGYMAVRPLLAPTDPRMLEVLLAAGAAAGLLGLGASALLSLRRKGGPVPAAPLRLSLLAATGALLLFFLPASGLFFAVGFTIAERTLYAPTAMACIAFAAVAWTIAASVGSSLARRGVQKHAGRSAEAAASVSFSPAGLLTSVAVAVAALGVGASLLRASDWDNEHLLWESAARDAPSAKSWRLLGRSFAEKGMHKDALACFSRALVEMDALRAFPNVRHEETVFLDLMVDLISIAHEIGEADARLHYLLWTQDQIVFDRAPGNSTGAEVGESKENTLLYSCLVRGSPFRLAPEFRRNQWIITGVGLVGLAAASAANIIPDPVLASKRLSLSAHIAPPMPVRYHRWNGVNPMHPHNGPFSNEQAGLDNLVRASAAFQALPKHRRDPVQLQETARLARDPAYGLYNLGRHLDRVAAEWDLAKLGSSAPGGNSDDERAASALIDRLTSIMRLEASLGLQIPWDHGHFREGMQCTDLKGHLDASRKRVAVAMEKAVHLFKPADTEPERDSFDADLGRNRADRSLFTQASRSLGTSLRPHVARSLPASVTNEVLVRVGRRLLSSARAGLAALAMHRRMFDMLYNITRRDIGTAAAFSRENEAWVEVQPVVAYVHQRTIDERRVREVLLDNPEEALLPPVWMFSADYFCTDLRSALADGVKLARMPAQESESIMNLFQERVDGQISEAVFDTQGRQVLGTSHSGCESVPLPPLSPVGVDARVDTDDVHLYSSFSPQRKSFHPARTTFPEVAESLAAVSLFAEALRSLRTAQGLPAPVVDRSKATPFTFYEDSSRDSSAAASRRKDIQELVSLLNDIAPLWLELSDFSNPSNWPADIQRAWS
jgi:hypothetical protein